MASEKSFNGVLAMSAIFEESVGTDPVKKRDDKKKSIVHSLNWMFWPCRSVECVEEERHFYLG